MVDYWNSLNIKTLVYVNPYFAQNSELFNLASSKGYLVKNKKNESYLANSLSLKFG